MYGTSGVIHVWYIRCDRDAAAAGQPPGQSSHPAGRGPGPGCLRGPRGPRWMAGLAWRRAGGGGISITPDESHLMYHT